jgi:hypothetical protein
MTINSQKELIEILAKKSRFIKGDVKIILDALIETLEEVVSTESNNFKDGSSEALLLKARGLGNIYSKKLPERKGNKGQMLPETTKIICRLAENIRFAGRNVKPEEEEIDDEEDYE